MQKLIIFLIIVSSLFSCASIKSTVENSEVISLANDVDFKLMQPKTYGSNLGFTQIAEIFSNGSVHELIFQTQIKNNTITVVGLLPNGTRIFLIEYNGTTIKSEGYSDVLEGIKPKYLLADLQLTLWPYKALMTQGFSNPICSKIIGCSFIEKENEKGVYLRTLKVANKDVIEIRYGNTKEIFARLDFHHLKRKYQIKLELIDTLEID